MRWVMAGLLAAGLWTAAQAQQAAPYASVATPALDPDLLKMPQAAPQTEPKNFRTQSDKDTPALAAPQGIQVGKSKLDFDVKNSDPKNRGVVPDSGSSSNLAKAMPGHKQDPTLPDYFGLKLTTPTH